MPKFKTIYLTAKRYTQGISETLIALIEYLEKNAVKVILDQETIAMLQANRVKKTTIYNLSNNYEHFELSKLKPQCDLIIVIGGDGSLLSTAKIAADQNIPIVGVNRGTLGFLTDINPEYIESIGKILRGNYIEETRFLLNASIKHDDKIINQDLALNDVVLLPSHNNRMIEFSVYINKQFVCTHKADGIIVATPTGSTAHALSGGGPILHPGLDAIVLLPMFPHTLSSRPIVVTGDSHIEIIMNKNYESYPNVSYDGRKLVPIPSSGKIDIKKHINRLRLIHLHDYNYFETLRVKLKWENK